MNWGHPVRQINSRGPTAGRNHQVDLEERQLRREDRTTSISGSIIFSLSDITLIEVTINQWCEARLVCCLSVNWNISLNNESPVYSTGGGANQPGGEQAKRQRSQRANKPGDEPANGRKSYNSLVLAFLSSKNDIFRAKNHHFVEKTKLKLMQKFVRVFVRIKLYQKFAIVSFRKL